MRLLMTGGSGFIGSALVRRLIRQTDHHLINLDALTYAVQPGALASAESHPRYRFVQGDIRDARLLTRLFAETQPEAVVHLAAESHVDRSISEPGAFVDTNINGTYHLLEAARDYWQTGDAEIKARFRLLHVSTDEVYGSLPPPDVADESSPYAPASPYAASKAAADHLVAAWHKTYGLPTLVTHGANTYGPFQHAEKLIPRMIEAALAGEPLPIYGDGQQIRDWLHVDDHAAAIIRVLEAGTPGAHYNIATGEARTNLDMVHALCTVVDEVQPGAAPSAALIRYVADRAGHDLRYAMDTRRIREQLGWVPKIPLVQGVADTVRWHVGQRRR